VNLDWLVPETIPTWQVRNFFYQSYQNVESVIDEWRPPGPGMMLPFDDAADVILEMLSRENRSPIKNLERRQSRVHCAVRL
jgi:hypothetical protein